MHMEGQAIVELVLGNVLAAVALWLLLQERKERQELQAKYNDYLQAVPDKLIDFANEQREAIKSLRSNGRG